MGISVTSLSVKSNRELLKSLSVFNLQSRRENIQQGMQVVGATSGLVLAQPSKALGGTEARPRSRVLVAGASGRSGVEVVRALLGDGRFEPVLQSRGLATRDESADGLKAFVCDVTSPDAVSTLTEALRKYQVNSVVCTLGFVPKFSGAGEDRLGMDAVDHRGVVALIEAAEAAHLAGRFVLVSSLLVPVLETSPGSDTIEAALGSWKPPNLSARMLNSLGGVVEAKALSEARLRASKTLDWTIIRPGVFVDSPQGGLIVGGAGRFTGESELDGRGLGHPVNQCKSPFFASSGAVCGITRAQLGEVCALVLTDPGASRNTLEVVARPDAASLAEGHLLTSAIRSQRKPYQNRP